MKKKLKYHAFSIGQSVIWQSIEVPFIASIRSQVYEGVINESPHDIYFDVHAPISHFLEKSVCTRTQEKINQLCQTN
jgi:hypothetical protein